MALSDAIEVRLHAGRSLVLSLHCAGGKSEEFQTMEAQCYCDVSVSRRVCRLETRLDGKYQQGCFESSVLLEQP
jgi:hypothetical protein